MYLGPVTRFVGCNVVPAGVVHFPYIHITTILVTFCLDTHHLGSFASVEELQHWIGIRRNHPIVWVCGVFACISTWVLNIGVAEESRHEGLGKRRVGVLIK